MCRIWYFLRMRSASEYNQPGMRILIAYLSNMDGTVGTNIGVHSRSNGYHESETITPAALVVVVDKYQFRAVLGAACCEDGDTKYQKPDQTGDEKKFFQRGDCSG